MGPRSDNRGYAAPDDLDFVAAGTSMGPRSDNRGYDQPSGRQPLHGITSMGPRSDNRGYDKRIAWLNERFDTSMGPRSDNRGYACCAYFQPAPSLLQWVRGLITAVMNGTARFTEATS